MLQGFAFEMLAVFGATVWVFVRWRRSITWKRTLLGAGAGLGTMVVSGGSGLHLCDSGTPPPWLAVAFGLALASLVSVSARRGAPAAILVFLLLAESIALPVRLSSAYHGPSATGNRNYASGVYWHTSLTGLRPRRSDGRWIPETSEDCRQSSVRCRGAGLCTKLNDRCVAATGDDCANSSDCNSEGRCSLAAGRCVAASDDDCRRRSVCTNQGRCTARNGECIPSSDVDCGASTYCREMGSCVAQGGHCEASDEGCARSDVCRDYGSCTRRDGGPPLNLARCEAATDADCRQARVRCQLWGYCTARGGQCMP